MNLYHMDDGTLLVAEPAPVERGFDPLRIKLAETGVVRYWGTTRGRGELAIDGPTEKTKTDVEPSGGELNYLHIRRIIPVSAKASLRWLSVLQTS